MQNASFSTQQSTPCHPCSGFAGRSNAVHPALQLLLDPSRTFFDHLCQRNLACLLGDIIVVVLQHKLVGINASNTTLDALCEYLWRELISTMQNDLHLAAGLLENALQSRRASSQS
jgi:hypothetical protein